MLQGVTTAVPHHVAFIPDGNRRFARSKNSPLLEGYRQGYAKIEEVLSWCGELRIPVVTVWVLSLDNLSRPADEVAALLQFIEEQIPMMVDLQRRSQVPRQLRCLGRFDTFQPGLRTAIAAAEQDTREFGPFRLNLALAYGGQHEIVDAVKRVLEKARPGESAPAIASRLTERDIQQNLYGDDPDPDLIIRTSGELRLGGFMLWKSVYSELFFCDALWPELRREDFAAAIEAYQTRDRRRGA